MNLTAFFIITGLLIILYIIIWVFDITNTSQKSPILNFVQIMIFIVVSMFSIAIAINYADARKQLESKCPELEKIENVYRIKK